MYSVVLMMALTGGGGDLPAFGHHGGCCGGYSSCCGGYGYGGYSSCCGGYAYGGYSCCGGYSSCCGGGYMDSCGCCGGGGRHHRHHGGCCGGYSSCCGGCYGGYTSCCGGSYGGYSCCGGNVIYGTAPVVVPPGGKAAEPVKPPKDTEKPKEESAVPAPATIIVSLPADAKLTIDDAATTSTSSLRVFNSPTLPVGRDFHYTLKAEYSRDGKPVTRSKEVTVRAGGETRVNLNDGVAGVASR